MSGENVGKLSSGRLSLFEGDRVGQDEKQAKNNNALTPKKSQNGNKGRVIRQRSIPAAQPPAKPPKSVQKISALSEGEGSKSSTREEKHSAEEPISLQARIKKFQQEPKETDIPGRTQSVMVKQKKPLLPAKPKRWISDPDFKGLPKKSTEKLREKPLHPQTKTDMHQHKAELVGDTIPPTKNAKTSPLAKLKKTPPQKPQRAFLRSISTDKEEKNSSEAIVSCNEGENRAGVKSIRERIQELTTSSTGSQNDPVVGQEKNAIPADSVARPDKSKVSYLNKAGIIASSNSPKEDSAPLTKNYHPSSGRVRKLSKPTVAPPKQPPSSSSLPSTVKPIARPLPSLPDTPPWTPRSPMSFMNRMYSDLALPVVFDDVFQPSNRRYSDEPSHVVLPSGRAVVIDEGGYALPSDTHPLLRRTKTVSPTQSPTISRAFRQRSLSLNADDDTTTLPLDDLKKQSKRQLLQKKINDVFLTLRGLGHKSRKQSLSQDKEDAYDSDEETTDLEHKHRLYQLKSVKEMSKYCTAESAKNSRMGNYPKLFDCILTVGLMPEIGKGHRPYIKDVYPPEGDYARKEDKVAAIPQFAFPDPDNWQMEATHSSGKSETYCFVLTNIDATRKYGCCRRVEPPLGEGLPEVYCILTPFPCVDLYSKVLDQIEIRRKISSARVKTFLEAAYPKPLPKPGKMVIIDVEGKDRRSQERLKLKRPHDSRFENADFECLLRTLNINTIINIFASILLERRIVFSAENLSTLSTCVTAMSALLYPFSWQHAYIPVLPTHLVEMCCAPTPYIVGVTASCVDKIKSLEREEILLVNLDTDCFEVCHGDESTLLPRKLQMALKESLHRCLNFETMHEMDMSLNEIFSEAFIRFFVETIGHYRHHMKPSSTDGCFIFQPESFRKVVPSKSIRKFLELFMESQMFSVFIEIKEVDSMEDNFDRLVRDYTEASSIGFRQKMKNWGRAIKLSAIESGQKIKDTAIKVKYSFENQI